LGKGAKTIINGGGANGYLQHLPIQHHIVIATDLVVILLLNSLIFLPYVVAVIYLFMEPGRSWSSLPNLILIALWAFSITLLQLLCLRKQKYLFLFFMLSFLGPVLMALPHHSFWPYLAQFYLLHLH